MRCPSEAFWPKVAADQPNLSASGATLQTLRVIDDTVHRPDAGVRAASLSGLVDHNRGDTYLLGLGASGAASDSCVLLGLSLASGRFTRVGEHTETTMEWRTPQGRPCSPPDAGADGGAGDAGVADCAPVPVTKRVAPPKAPVAASRTEKSSSAGRPAAPSGRSSRARC